MKKIWIFLSVIFLSFLIKYSFSQSPKIICSVETSCSYTHVFRISDVIDAHAEMNTQSNYPYIVCCRIDGSTLTVSQEISKGFIGLSNPTDAHVESGNENNYGYHLQFNSGYGEVFCDVADSCQEYDTCLVSISNLTNAHVGDCTTNPYQKKICCSLRLLDISLNFNASKAQWGEDIMAWGRATKNNLPLQNADVYIKINEENYTQIKTNSTGYYNFTFNIRKERIAKLNVSATVIDPESSKEKYVSKDLVVFLGFGYENLDSKNSLCRETPKPIQNPDGSIDIVIFKTCVWK